MRRKIERDIQAFVNGRISRRDLMQRATALGVVSALPLGVLSFEAKAAVPKRGGHLTLANPEGSTTDVLDTTKLTSGFTSMLFYTIYSQLTEVAPDGSLIPLLAESYESNADASVWTFDLRKGMEFHNGKSVDADDVMMSIARHQGEDSESAVKSLAEAISEMKKDGKHRVIFTLKEGNADFPFSLSAGPFAINPVIDGKIDTSGIGTGAYSLESFDSGIGAKLKRHANFHRDDRGFFDTVETTIIHDPATRSTSVITGQVDYAGGIDPKTADLLAKKAGVNVLEITGMQHYLYAMRTDLAPYNNVDVRLALKYAMDREEILKNVLRGHGSLGNDHPISPANRYYAGDAIPQRQYDPDKAKFHMKKAGMMDATFEISATNGLFEGALDAAVLFSEHAKRAGINVVPKQVPADGYWSDVWMKHPFAASYWSGRPTEDWMFSQGYAEESSWNETFWKHPKFNSLLKSARAELDDAKRRNMYVEMQQLVHDDGGALVFLFANHISAFGDKLSHPDTVAGNWEFDGYKMIERWWFNS